MIGSKYSGMGASKMSFRNIEDICHEHEGEPLINFCSAITCIKPLCPQCIENHYNYHKNIRTAPQIQSFKTVKLKCDKKIAQTLQNLGIDDDVNLNELNFIFDESLRRIKEAKQNCRKIIDTYFINLEDFIKKKMNKVTSQQSDLFSQMDKVNNIINQLKMLSSKIENPRTFLESAETIIKLDTDRIQEKVREGLDNIMRFKESHRNNLVIQRNYQEKTLNFMSNTFFYGNKQNLQAMPKVVEQLKNKNHQQVLSRSRSKDNMDYSQISTKKHSTVVGDRYGQMIQSSSQFRDQSSSQFRDKSYERQRDEDKKSTRSRRSSRSSSKHRNRKQIIGMNTFASNSCRKYLHFFQHDENILHYLDIEQSQGFQQIKIDFKTPLPDFHKSIAVSKGDLYLIGGNDPQIQGQKSQKIYKYDFDRNKITHTSNLKQGRSSHSICFNNKYIYILGGYLNNQIITNKCQRYDIQNNKIEQIRSFKYEACSFASCSFGGRFIYKFGGVSESGQNISRIERFDQKSGQWEVINPFIDKDQKNTVQLLSTSAAIQIAKQQIMVIGGYDNENMGQRQTFILKVDQKGDHIIKDINIYPLPIGEGFWNGNPIIHKKLVFVLQNVSVGEECLEGERKILCFNGEKWNLLN